MIWKLPSLSTLSQCSVGKESACHAGDTGDAGSIKTDGIWPTALWTCFRLVNFFKKSISFFPFWNGKKFFKHLYNCCVLETDNLFFSHRSVDREMLPQDRVYPEFHLNLFEMRVSWKFGPKIDVGMDWDFGSIEMSEYILSVGQTWIGGEAEARRQTASLDSASP